MATPLAIATVLGAFLLLMFLGLPVAFGLIGTSIVFLFLFMGPTALFTVYSNSMESVTKDTFVAVPLFIFMAAILQYSGMGSLLYNAMYKWFAGLRGGLAIATVLACTIIAAVSGVVATGTVVMGLLAYPEMQKRGYDRSLALGSIAAGGTLGPLIPPSVIMILIGGYASLSVGKLFMGGVIPGLIASVLFIFYIIVRCALRPDLAPAMPQADRATTKEKMLALRGVILPLLLAVLVLGAIYTGASTPSEAGGVGALGGLIISAVHRQLNWRNLRQASLMSLKVTCMVTWLLMGGNTFKSLLIMTGIGRSISAAIASSSSSLAIVLLIMMAIPLFMGMFIDGAAITMILIPIFMPVVAQLGIDPLWFALLFIINLQIGHLSPPFGVSIFYTKGIAPDVPMTKIYDAMWAFCGLYLLLLVASALFPPIITWLPGTMAR